jgi:beta-glucosidase
LFFQSRNVRLLILIGSLAGISLIAAVGCNNPAENLPPPTAVLTPSVLTPSVQRPSPAVDAENAGLPLYQDPNAPIPDRVADLLARMTLDEKIGQMTQVERGSLNDIEDIATYRLGSLLSGGGSSPSRNTPTAWADMVDGFQEVALRTPLQIPLLYGTDAVHGHNNVIGATIFPHNIGLGATRNPDLIQQIGRITAEEVYATGIHWSFSPCLCVARDERWGRTYESFGEDPEIASMMTVYIDGLQGTDLSAPNTIMATAKHWVGDGGTEWGTSANSSYQIDQGNTILSEEELRAIHIAPYIEAVNHGVGAVMPSYSSWNGEKLHGHSYLINDVLKGELGFEGFVISDWQAIDHLPGGYGSDVRTSINAGIDMVMVPHNYVTFITTLRSEIEAGSISMARIDDAVSRILTKKFELGLFERPYSDRTEIEAIGSAAHREVARQAVRESLVLLKNEDDLLPLPTGLNKVLVAGSNANNIGNQSGGWTITWQGSSGAITPGTTIFEGIEAISGAEVTFRASPRPDQVSGYDIGIVVIGEKPYAEGNGDSRTLSISASDVAAVNQVCEAMPCVVVLVSGRPLIIHDQLEQADAFVAAWLPGTEGDGLAEVLFGLYNFSGTLPVSWPRDISQVPINRGDTDYDPLFPYGFGLTYP